ncbi:putative ubiquitin supergroup protein [Neofusicoccum parvum]|nr:putative ubiquitin supergroup protein [Neofusicoccum parvum]
MTEVSFAKQFLTALESRPSRLSSDHVVDPKTYPAQPAFILPRMPQPKRKPASRAAAAPGATPANDAPTTTAAAASPTTPQPPQQPETALVTLKPTRATHPTHTLPAPVPVATTSMHDLKRAYAAAAPGVGVAKIKILLAKKPVGDTKTIRDVLPPATEPSAHPIPVEFSVMVLGGGGGGATPTAAGTPAISTPERVASPPATTVEVEMGEAPVAAGPADAAGVLGSEEFWADLKGFLVGRLRDEVEGERLVGVFREAWTKGGA